MEGGGGSSGQYKKGLWTVEEDRILMDYISVHGKGKWNRVAKVTGLKRCGKSCRLRWMNYLRPNVKRDNFSEEEDDLIIRLHNLLGNRWSLIAGRVPGRTDNQVKNYWNTHLSKRLGVKKAKCKVTTSSSPGFSKELIKKNSSNLPSSNCEPNPFRDEGATSQNAVEVCSDSTTREPSIVQEMATITDWDENSFLFLNDYRNFWTPSLMEVLNESLDDFFWCNF